MDGVRGRQALAGNNEGEAAIKNLKLKQTKGARLTAVPVNHQSSKLNSLNQEGRGHTVQHGHEPGKRFIGSRAKPTNSGKPDIFRHCLFRCDAPIRN